MKKAISIFAVIVYFAFTSGVIVNLHYCMDRYDSFRLYQAASDYCTKCGMHTKDHGCCHDEVKIVKIEDDHQTSSVSFAFTEFSPEIIILPDFIVTDTDNDHQQSDYLNHSPPLLKGQEIYIINRVFRI